MVRNLDIARSSTDARSLEVVAEGLAIFGGVQYAVDATLVSAPPLRRNSVEESRHDVWDRPPAREEAQGRQIPGIVRSCGESAFVTMVFF